VHGGGDRTHAAFGERVLEGAVEVAGEALLALGRGEGDEGAALLDQGLELGVGEEVVEGGGAQAREAGGAGTEQSSARYSAAISSWRGVWVSGEGPGAGDIGRGLRARTDPTGSRP
jgi:hypothetical protein